MAQKKRGPGRPAGSKNKRGSKSNEPPKTKGQKIDEMQEQRKHDRKVVDEIWAVTLFALGIFFVFTIWLDSTGAFGAAVHDVCRGLFGLMAYVLPVYFFVCAFLLFLQKVQHITIRTTIFSSLIFLMMCVLNSYRFINEKNLKFAFTDIAEYYKQGVNGELGGCIGMEIGSLLVKFLGKPGLIIFAVAVIVISLLLVVNTPMSKGLSSVLDKRERKKLLTEMQEAEAKKELEKQQAQPVKALNSPYGPGDIGPDVISKQDAIDQRYTMIGQDTNDDPITQGILTTEPLRPPQLFDEKGASKQTGLFSFFKSKQVANEIPSVNVDKNKAEENRKKVLELAKDDASKNIGMDSVNDSSYGFGLGNNDGKYGTSYGLEGNINDYSKGYRAPDRRDSGTGFGLGDYDLFYSLDPSERKEKADNYYANGLSNAANYRAPKRNINSGLDAATSVGGTAMANAMGVASAVGAVQSVADKKPRKNSAADRDLSDTDDFGNEITAAFNSNEDNSGYKLPPTSLLKKSNSSRQIMNDFQMQQKAELLEETLASYGVDAKVINVTQGASVTRYEVQPATGVKVSKITGLADDIALNLRAKSIRIEAPIPGKAAVGIEVENDKPSPVLIRDMIECDEFINSESKLSFVVGKDISGNNIVSDLKKMPHLLIAGTTGSGKSVCVNSIITSILYKAKPNEVKMIMIDPKVVELGNYNGIPHMLSSVVTDPRKASRALAEAVVEMDKRYEEFAKARVKDLESYNELMIADGEPQNCKPSIVIIIDELADLMMAAPSQVEESICRIAQKARAAGMHLIVATQRPSVDVVTGLIKANISSRIAFAVTSQIDSRTILDMAGAEKLLGKGDMLFSPIGCSKPFRVQGPFISDIETNKVIKYVKGQADPEYDEELINAIEGNSDSKSGQPTDDLTEDAVAFILKSKQASVSMLQRRFRIGYNRAARIIDEIEAMGIIGPSDGSRPRQVLMTEDEYYGNFSENSEVDNEVIEVDAEPVDGDVPEELF